MPCTPSAAASDLASTTLIAPGSPAGSVRRRRDQTGAPVTVAVTCAIVAADARPSVGDTVDQADHRRAREPVDADLGEQRLGIVRGAQLAAGSS